MKRIRGYNNIYQIWPEDSNPKSVLYKYMNIERAIQFLQNGEYYFVEPIAWQDPYEKRFYTADYSNIQPYVPQRIFATCLTDRVSNEAAWKMYRDDRGGLGSRCIRLEINRAKLFHQLDKVKNGKFVFGKANYKYTSKTIDTIHIKESPQYNYYFSDFSEEKFLELLLIKRKAFEYENEVRLFFIPDESNSISYEDYELACFCNYVIKFDESFLKEMIISVSIDPSCSNLEVELLKAKIEKLGYTCSKNSLYKVSNRIIIES